MLSSISPSQCGSVHVLPPSSRPMFGRKYFCRIEGSRNKSLCLVGPGEFGRRRGSPYLEAAEFLWSQKMSYSSLLTDVTQDLWTQWLSGFLFQVARVMKFRSSLSTVDDVLRPSGCTRLAMEKKLKSPVIVGIR